MAYQKINCDTKPHIMAQINEIDKLNEKIQDIGRTDSNIWIRVLEHFRKRLGEHKNNRDGLFTKMIPNIKKKARI